jgi:lysozyme
VTALSGVAVALSLTAVPDAHASVAVAVAAPIRGLDVSAHQHAGSPINWGLLTRQGLRFVAVKVSEGTYYRNSYYASDARAAAAAGLAVLSYVFANPSSADGTATAKFAVGALGHKRGPARLPLVVDLENDPYKKAADCYGLHIPAMIAWIARFTKAAKDLTGKWPVIYTTAAWWQECTSSTGQFRRDPLWLAAFDGTPPTLPSPWLHWTFWQYSNDGSLPGIGQTDLDYYSPSSSLPSLSPPRRRAKQKPAQKTKPPRHLKNRPARRAKAKHNH